MILLSVGVVGLFVLSWWWLATTINNPEKQGQFCDQFGAWKKSRILVKNVYQLLDNFPKFENYALCDQIRRSIVSVPSNLAEGSGKISIKESLSPHKCQIGRIFEFYGIKK